MLDIIVKEIFVVSTGKRVDDSWQGIKSGFQRKAVPTSAIAKPNLVSHVRQGLSTDGMHYL